MVRASTKWILSLASAGLLIWIAVFLTIPYESVERLPASGGHLPPVSRWQLVGVFPLGGPTGHPQGVNVTPNELELSYQGDSAAGLTTYRVSRNGDQIAAVSLDRAISFARYSGLTHAGGLGRSSDRSTIYIPIAAKPFGKTVILSVGPQGVREVAWFPFHIGAVFVDPGGQYLRAIGFDEGAHFEIFGNTVYTVEIASGKRMSAVTPSTGESFQDCKPIGDKVLCSNKVGSNFVALRGSVDLVKFEPNGSYRVIERLSVPHVNLDGSFGIEWGPYLPGIYGTPPLTYNAFDYEWSRDRKSLYFYFVPNDEPDTRLYVYKLALE